MPWRWRQRPFNLVIGLSVGALAGYYQGATNTLLMKITEFFQVLPPLLSRWLIVSLFSPSAGMIAVAIGLVTWPPLARLTRSEFMLHRELEYVAAAGSPTRATPASSAG